MKACICVVGPGVPDELLRSVRELVGGEELPLPNGTLIRYSPERFTLTFDRILDKVRAGPGARWIWTVGAFNGERRPCYYDLYARYALALDRPDGEILLCPQVYALAQTHLHLGRSIDFMPLCVAQVRSAQLIDTAFGRVETSARWYTTHSVDYVDPHQPLDAMTRKSELSFWYSPAGFMYLAHQAACIRAYRTHSRRIVTFARSDLTSYRFLKLVFTFEAIGIRLYFVYDEDFMSFAAGNGLGAIEIFSRAGDNSFVAMNGEAHYSGSQLTAERIVDAQAELLGNSHPHDSVRDFMRAYETLMPNVDTARLQHAAESARSLMEKFSQYPAATQRVILTTYVERWKQL